MMETASLMVFRSLAASSTSAPPRFSARRCSFVVPGIGTIHGLLASSQARANLRLSCFFLVGDAAECVHQRLVRFSVFRVEPGNDVPKIVLFELCIFLN